ncbi:hypothetical protein UFOVP573_24 [uncultured Caudovirales phage]|uniref:Uncharacterized protein n=1 Tax=uncultured Caudovirales phage TaxID=2100421 RepID=A0A6J5SNC8_9CAUD|nr:hypothetical protein UFOVP288_91 [uncultured Caudovirales phage]CAB4146143.1 hypothetical protein UFOVP483_105 [uncultured Caudovirales phage]CAB4150703.1 hypothetical protein UFOVP573_24 [uncultured Caudovirales phage]CAB4161577.1 hypothetical protein UFOVP769_91 [uncultured Caudovirales phage]CAB4174534.1 hypothetical protein UFOVP962_59 [uncultured Caudovirales phage]
MMVNTILNTDYDVFNYVKQHLLNQNERSLDPWSLQCQYRSQKEDGKILMCAVGCLIDDNFYSEKLENCSPSDLDVRKAVENSIFSDWEYNVSLLSELQNIHDEYEHDEWSLKLESLESYFNENNEYIQAG